MFDEFDDFYNRINSNPLHHGYFQTDAGKFERWDCGRQWKEIFETHLVHRMGYYTHGPDGIIHCPKTGHYERKNNKIKPITEEEAKKRPDEVIKISRFSRWLKKIVRVGRKKGQNETG